MENVKNPCFNQTLLKLFTNKFKNCLAEIKRIQNRDENNYLKVRISAMHDQAHSPDKTLSDVIMTMGCRVGKVKQCRHPQGDLCGNPKQ